MSNALLAAPSKIVTGIPQLRGERVTAIQDADGTWCLKRLPIFATVDAGAKGNEKDIDEAWLRDCVSTMRGRYEHENQYVAPVHVYHHDQQTEDAGYFVPVEVAPYKFSDGTTRPAIYADLFKVPDAVYQRIRANRLCFRSVEIIKYAERELGSLALMKDEVPFHRFANTTIGEEIRNEAVTAYTANSPIVQTIRAKGRAVHLFRFNGGSMADEEKEKKDGPPPDKAEGKAKEEEKSEDGKTSASQPGDAEAGQNQLAAVIAQGFAALDMKLTAVFSLLSGAQGQMAGTGTPNLAPVKPVSQMKATEEKMDAQFIARIGAVEAALKAQKDEADSAKRFSAAMDELAGRHVPEQVKTSLRELSKGPEGVFRATLDIVKTTLPYDPPTYRDGQMFAAGTTDVSEMPEAVQKAVATGKGEKAIKLFREFEAHNSLNVSKGPENKPLDFDRFQKIDALRNAHLDPACVKGRN